MSPDTRRDTGRAAPGPEGDAIASEQTPLLAGSTSPTLNNASDYDDHSGEQSETATEIDVPNHPVTVLRGIGVAISLWLFIFLQATNLSGMSLIQGSIAEDLSSHSQVMWLTTSFLIPMSSFVPIAGRLAGIFEPRLMVLPISFCLAVGSFICALSQSFTAFVVGRVVSGTGASGVLVVAVVTVLELTSKEKRGLFIGLVNTGMTVGVSFGAIVYGALLPVIGWRPLFWVQTPLVLIAGTALFLSLPKAIASNDKAQTETNWQKALNIDYLGAILLTLSIVLFLYGLSGDIHPTPLSASLLTLLIFTTYEFRVPTEPIIPLQVLSSRGALLSCLAQVGLMSARWTVLFYTPIFMLSVHGAAPARAGSILIPSNLGFALGGLVVGWLHVRRAGSFWLPSLVSLGAFAVALYGLALTATPGGSIPWFIAFALAGGFATGAFLNYTLAHVIHLSPRNTEYVTTSLLNTFRGFGGSFGTSIGGGIFYRVLRTSLTSGFEALDDTPVLSPKRQQLIVRLLGNPALVFNDGLDLDERAVAVDGYADASRSVWTTAALLAVAMIVVQALTGWSAPAEKEEANADGERSVVDASR